MTYQIPASVKAQTRDRFLLNAARIKIGITANCGFKRSTPTEYPASPSLKDEGFESSPVRKRQSNPSTMPELCEAMNVVPRGGVKQNKIMSNIRTFFSMSK